MNPDSTLSISLICLVISCVVGVLSYLNSKKKDSTADTQNFVKVNFKLDDLCDRITGLTVELKTTQKEFADLDKRMAVLERDVKTAFNHLDELRGALYEHHKE